MPLSIPHSFTQDTPSSAPNVNSNFSAVKVFVDALQDGTGFNAGAIGTTDLADSAVTLVKLDAGARADAQSAQFVLANQIFG